ncbi:MAG TPA: hypothetical protein VFX85_09745 [Solirubrobacterales bacterium]|nr:hypothetical protein [Solirubrobacterales bacterium]
MAVAAPKRRTAPAPPPSRTTPPPRRKAAAPATAPRKKAAPAKAPGKRAPAKAPAKRAARHSPRARVAAPARQAPARKAPTRKAPARKAPARKSSARSAPSRARSTAQSARAVSGQLIPLAGRTAVAVGQLPDSGLVVRLTRGRAWIAVLGALLAGIVALNVVTLSFAASAGRIDEQITLLDQEISVMKSKDARLSGIGPVRNAAGSLGLTMPASDEIHFTDAGPESVATAAQRLAAATP